MLRVRYAWLVLLISCNFLVPSFAQDFSDSKETLPYTINNPSTFNKTALQYFSVAQSKLIEQEWQSAYALADHATIYDDSIADLYYIMAISLYEQGAEYYRVIPLLEKSLDKTTVAWYSFNRDSARLLLSSMLVSVKKPEEALELIDENIVLTNSDALFIRSKANYIQNNLELARFYVMSGAKQFPLDTRFDELFYTYEYKNLISTVHETVEEDIQPLNTNLQDEFKILRDFFNSRVEQFSQSNQNLLLFAGIFSESSEEKTRLLRAWNTQGKTHPLFAIYALKENMLNEIEAFNYMKPFFADINYSLLTEFISLIQDEEVMSLAQEYFLHYEGIIRFDENQDLQNEVLVKYERGRPSLIQYDDNQDGKLLWEIVCDFGVPISIDFFNDEVFINYDSWPYIHTIEENYNSNNKNVYYLVSDAISLPVVRYEENDVFKNTLRMAFYTPFVAELDTIDFIDVYNAAYSIDAKVNEYDDSRVRYTLLDGVIKNAVYSDSEVPYAYMLFENGLPVMRNVDKDRNGSFEIIEIFEQSDSFDDSLLSIFGFEYIASSVKLKSVSVDLNDDGLDDFTQEYIATGSNVSFWDSNSDGKWDVQFTQSNDRLNQEIHYIHPITGDRSIIRVENDIPVLANGKEVVLDSTVNFYWIGENLESSYATKIITELSLKESAISLMVTDLLWNKDKDQFMRIVGVKNGDTYFGEVYYE